MASLNNWEEIYMVPGFAIKMKLILRVRTTYLHRLVTCTNSAYEYISVQ